METLTPTQIEALEAYAALLRKWNAAYNLVGSSTLESLWERHIADSLAVLPYLPHAPSVLADMGTGAGLPGVVLAIAAPHHSVHLMEANQKKCLFLHEVVRQLHLSHVTVHHSRIEDVPAFPADVILARAFAPLPRLLETVWPFIAPHTQLLLHKGVNMAKECDASARLFSFESQDYPGHSPGSHLLSITHVSRGLEGPNQ